MILVFSGWVSFPSFSQEKKEKIRYSAEGTLEGGVRNGEKVRKLIDGVVFTQKNTKIFSDSAYFYDERNALEAFGRVKILEGDSITITGENLQYDGDLKIAKMRGNVIYRDPNMTLYTDYLNYDMIAKLAVYYDGGKLVDPENVLTSKKGYYQTEARFISFKEDVVLVNPEYTLKSDTLQYNTATKVAYVKGPSQIIAKDGTILNTVEGQFNTVQKQSTFTKGEIITDNYRLTGDNLFADDSLKYYTASKNVQLTSLKDEVVITGSEGRYSKLDGITKIYGNAVMKKAVNLDTMYLSSDTLISIEKPGDNNKMVIAFYDVKIFKEDMQGRTDSLVYNFSDSTIYLFRNPILWSEGNQIIADSINIQLANNEIDKMNMTANSFVISQDTAKNYNQVKGRDMIAHFKEGKIDKVNVYGNGESLYFVLEENLTVGLNKSLSSNMLIKFSDSRAQKITFYTKPDASFIPPHELKKPDLQLKGFEWKMEMRPDKEEVLRPRDGLTKPKEKIIPTATDAPLEKPAKQPLPLEAKKKRNN